MFRLSPAIAIALLSLAGAAQAAAIHKWVDDKGVTHYADAPPEQSPTPVTQLQIDTGAPTAPADEYAAGDHYYSIANQWQRMQRESLKRQERELQRAALKSRQQATTVVEYREPRGTRYVAAYPRRFYRRHGHYPQPPIEHYGGSQPPPAGQLGSGFPTTVD